MEAAMRILAAALGLAMVVVAAAGQAPARTIHVTGDTASAHSFTMPMPTSAPGGIEVLLEVR
jgi:hypothetical protein